MSDSGEDVASADIGYQDASDVAELLDDLHELRSEVEGPEARELVSDAIESAADLQPRGFGNVIVGYDKTDAAEAFLGSVLFGIPMFVEGGTQEVGEFIAAHPVYLAGTLGAAFALVIGILYVADFQDVIIHRPILGVVPRRLLGVLAIAFTTSVLAMTAWGRVDWGQPWLALCTVSVAYVPMAIGAAVTDILPGS